MTPGLLGSQSPTVAPKIHRYTGRNSPMPVGTVKERSTDAGDPNDPPRNQTWPLCPTPAYWPVVSVTGFCATGIPRAHCHHSALHSPYVFPYGCDLGGRIFELASSDRKSTR